MVYGNDTLSSYLKRAVRLYSDLTKTPDLVPCIDPWREDDPVVDVQSGKKQYISPMYTCDEIEKS